MGGPDKIKHASLDIEYNQDEYSISSLNSNYAQNISDNFFSSLYSMLNPSDVSIIQNQETENAVKIQFSCDNNNNYNNEDTIKDYSIYNIKTNETKKITKENKKNKKQIFYIIKKRNIRGRCSNAYKEKHKNVKYIHSKSSNDNIIRKLKTSFIKELLAFVNKVYLNEYQKIYKNPKKEQKWLYDITKKSKITISKFENLAWLNMTVKEFLSSDVSRKNKNYEIRHNANEIKKVCDEGEMEEVIKILNMKIKEVFDIYVKGENLECSGVLLITLETNFNIENAKNEDEIKYIEKVKDVGENFETNYLNKKTRRK